MTKKPGVEPLPKGLSFKWAEYCYRFNTFINCYPFRYNKQLRRFQESSKFAMGLWLTITYFCFVIEVGQVTWALARISGGESQEEHHHKNSTDMHNHEVEVDPAAKNLRRQKKMGEFCVVLFVWISWVAVFTSLTNSFVMRKEFINSTNKLIQCREYFTEAKLPPSNDYKVIRAYCYVGGFQCFFQCLMVASEGWKSHYLYSNVPEEYRTPVTGLIWAVYAYFRVLSNYGQGMFTIFSGILHIQTCNQILTLRSQSTFDPRESIKMYRILQLLCIWFNESYSTITIPGWTATAVSNIILGTFGAIRFYGILDPPAYMNFPLMNLFMIIFCLTYYPRKATLKERTQAEKKKMLWVCFQGFQAQKIAPVFKGRNFKAAPAAKGQNQVEKNEGASLGENGTGRVQMWKGKGQWQKGNFAVNANIDVQPQEERSEGMPKDKGENKVDKGQPQKPKLTPGPLTLSQKKWDELKEIECYARSCPTVGVHMGSFYMIQRSTVLTLFDFIACNTVSALLTWPV